MKNEKKKAPETLVGGVVNQKFSKGTWAETSAQAVFSKDGTLVWTVTGGAEKDDCTFTSPYKSRSVSKKTVLVSFCDVQKDLYVTATYNFATGKVFAFVWEGGKAATAKGTFTWKAGERK